MKTAYKNRFTRVISVLLAAVMLFGYLMIPGTVRAEEEPFRIESSRISDGTISFYRNEKPAITVTGYPVGAKFQWQIAMPEGEGWVDIMGQEEETLVLSYALVSEIMDEDGTTSVRCKSTCNGANDFTPPVDVKVLPGMAEPEVPIPTEAPTEPVEETTAPTDAPTEPAEETSAPTDAPTEPAEETTAPTDAPTEPVEETTAPTDAPTEPAEETTAPTEPAAVVHEVDPGAITGQTSNADGDDENIVTITIQYIYWDRHNNVEGDMVWNPYTARIKKGESLHITVDNRSRPAYTTELAADNPEGATLGTHVDTGGNSTGISYVKLDLDNVQTDLTFKVYYKEIMVPYAARYFLQNINNDLYTEYDTYYEVFEGYQGDAPDRSLIEKDVVGFSYLFEYPDTIAADGSTVFEVYYDRLYYLIDFDLDGGFGTAPVYARYETTFNVAEPEKPGFVFDGWKLVEQDGVAQTDKEVAPLPTQIPAHNQTYQAQWKVVTANYTVVYWRENANDSDYSYWTHETRTATTGTQVSGTQFQTAPAAMTDGEYFTYNANMTTLAENARTDKVDGKIIVEGDDSTVVNVYFSRNYYTITFTAKAKCGLPEHTHGTGCNKPLTCFLTPHAHDESCGGTLSCTLTEHQHTEECVYTCGKTEHQHTAACYSCEEHSHVKGCYSNVGNETNAPYGSPTNPSDGTIYTDWWNNRYIYIGGRWYRYSGNENSGTVISPTCGKNAHTHGDGSCTYKDAEHLHNDSCYGHASHTHDASCYTYSCDSQGHTHTDACYADCILEKHTHDEYCSDSSRTNTVYRITAKYGADISDHWPIASANGTTYNSGERWSPSGTDLYDEVLVFIQVMPPDDFTLSLNTSNKNDYTMNYFVQALPGDTVERPYDGMDFVRPFDAIVANYGYITKAEDFFDIEGFTQYKSDPSFNGGTQIKPSDFIADFYYTRNSYALKFMNHGTLWKTENIPYDMPLTDYEPTETVPYPDGLEVDAYVFEQWYLTDSLSPGTEVDWSAKMPASEQIVYAKWVPITHTVNFYLDYDLLSSKTPAKTVSNVIHGTVMPTVYTQPPTHPTHTDYRFVQWFYIQDGQKYAFEPSKMEVKKDLELYAEWTTTDKTQYTIRYLAKDTNKELASPTTGYAFVATTKTFTAKPAEDLNLLPAEEREKLWLPATNSHSILMKSEAEKNTFTFYYEVKQNAPYTVRYEDKDTGKELGKDEVDPNTDAVVTPKFKYFEDYVPDDFYKRLVLSANEDENVVTFYYTKVKEGEGAYYVAHKIQNLDEKGMPIEGSYSTYFDETRYGKIDSTVTENPMTIAGYVYDPENSVTSGVITRGDNDNGLELTLYYTPLQYSYTVRYLDSATNQPVYNPYISETEHYFGSTVYADAVPVNGYELAGDETEKKLVIGAVEERNVITFYYNKKPVIINYKVTSTDLPGSACGTLSRSYETPQDYTKDIQGCTADPNAGFRFQGWYYDEACTKPVSYAFGTEITPAAVDIDKGTKENIYEFTYYARFEPITLTITKDGKDIDPNDTFFFRVKGTTSGVDITVSIQGTVSVTLAPIPVDTYTVTELTGWSWTYSAEDDQNQKTVTVQNGEDTRNYTVDFINEVKHTDWLHAETHIENQFDHQVEEEPEDATETESKT